MNKTILQEDLRKLHSAINQNENLRLTLILAGITIIGTVLGWSSGKCHQITYFATIFLYISLLCLLWFSFYIRSLQERMVSYLIASKTSFWEINYKIYCNNKEVKERKYETVSYDLIYILFGIIVLIFPFINNAFSLKYYQLYIHLLLALLYFMFIWRIQKYNNKNKKTDFYLNKWKDLTDNSDST